MARHTEAYSAVGHHDSHPRPAMSRAAFVGICLATLGVVYGDIGTSPLYAMSEIFFGHADLAVSRTNVLGATSLVFWTLTTLVCGKYLAFVLRADNHGEGGVFSLMALLTGGRAQKVSLGVSGAFVLAAGLLYGEGLITPAISVLSAVEGLRVGFHGLDRWVVPITVVVLLGLFAIQRRGTEGIGKVFGPIILLWFSAIGGIGALQVIGHPDILWALSPTSAVAFVASMDLHKLLAVLGSVLLAVTGCEALYADMGHFGARPIRVSWFSIAYPALLLSYLGQGAFLLSGAEVHDRNVFYSHVPGAILIPMILLATCATVIASQALISGAFSLTRQAIAMGLFPRLRIVHTSESHEGQIYLPAVNWALCAGCIALVVGFGSSTSLAAAYGFAVATVMTTTTVGVGLLSHRQWRWPTWMSLAVFVPIFLIDAAFFTAAATKFDDGGYMPFVIGAALFIVMSSWRWGRQLIAKGLANITADDAHVDALVEAKRHTIMLPRSVVVMTSRPIEHKSDPIPPALQSFWDRFGALPKHIIFLTVVQEPVPRVPRGKRLDVIEFSRSEAGGTVATVRLHCGYLDEANVQSALKVAKRDFHVKIPGDPSKWLVVVGQERLIGKPPGLFSQLRLRFFNMMLRNSVPAHDYLGLGAHAGVTTETMILRCHEKSGEVTGCNA